MYVIGRHLAENLVLRQDQEDGEVDHDRGMCVTFIGFFFSLGLFKTYHVILFKQLTQLNI
jgi:hypothetical protein